jgi:hypothetical protein
VPNCLAVLSFRFMTAPFYEFLAALTLRRVK